MGETWFDSGNIAKVNPTGFLVALDVGHEKREGFGPHTWKDAAALH